MLDSELKSLVVAADIADQAAKKDSKLKAHKALPEVKNFQTLEGTLTPDGKWGPNSYFAASFYLQRDATKPIWSKNAAVTWDPPVSAPQIKVDEPTVVTVPKKAKKKVAAKPKKKVVAKPVSKPAAKPVVKAKPKAKKKVAPKKKTIHETIIDAVKDDMPAHGQDDVLQTNSHDIEQALANTLSKQITKTLSGKYDKELKTIKAILKKFELQNQATSEHKAINKKNDFEKTVLANLAKLIKAMPKGPQKTAVSKRFLGLVLP